MVDKPQPPDADPTPAAPGAPVAPAAPRRGPGHRGADMRDTVAEMAERAQLISQEAGSKVAAAMKDVISAAAGIAGFAIESARDLVQYMVKRGQMTPEEADKLIREAEAAHDKRPASEKGRPTATKIAAEKAAIAKAEAAARLPPSRRRRRSGPCFAQSRRHRRRPLNRRPLPPSKPVAKPAAKTVAKASKPVAKSPKADGKSAKPAGKSGERRREEEAEKALRQADPFVAYAPRGQAFLALRMTGRDPSR